MSNYKEINRDKVLTIMKFGDKDKVKFTGGRGAIMILNKALKFQDYNSNELKDTWSLDIDGKNIVIEYNPGFDVYRGGKEDLYAGLPMDSYKADFYVYGLGRVDRYCRIFDFSTLEKIK